MTFDNEKIKKYKEKKEAFKKENINNHVIKKYGYIHYSRKKEMKELDVVYDEGIWGTLLLLRRSTQGKLALPLNYSIGALKQLKYDSRRTNKEIYNAQGIKEFDDFIFKNECNELEKELTLYNKITIWSKYNDTNNALLPLYFVNRFYDVIKEKEISIIYIDEKDNPNIDLDSYSIEEFENKVANRKIITRENLKYWKNEWDNLIQKDSDIRKLNFPEISHHYLEEYKEKIISLYSNGMKFNQLILAVMDSLKLTYSESMYLIYEMSQKGIFLFKNDGKGFLKVDRTVLLRKPVEEELNKKYKAVKFLKDDIYMVSSISTNIFPYYHDEHADVTELGLWGIVNSDKEILIDTKYLYSFYEVGENKFIGCKGDTWKKINSTTRGNAVVSDNKKFGLIDIEDNVIIPFEYDEMDAFQIEFSESKKIMCVKALKYGDNKDKKDEAILFDLNGKILIPGDYEDFSWYGNENRVIVHINGDRFSDEEPHKCGVYDIEKQKLIIPLEYLDLEEIDGNYYHVILKEDDSGFIIDLNNNKIGEKDDWKYIFTEENGYRGTDIKNVEYTFDIIDGKIENLSDTADIYVKQINDEAYKENPDIDKLTLLIRFSKFVHRIDDDGEFYFEKLVYGENTDRNTLALIKAILNNGIGEKARKRLLIALYYSYDYKNIYKEVKMIVEDGDIENIDEVINYWKEEYSGDINIGVAKNEWLKEAKKVIEYLESKRN